MLRKREVPMCFYPTRKRKFQKNSKIIQKVKKKYYGFFSSQDRLQKNEKGRKKKIILMGSRQTCNKNYKKIQKIKNPVIASFQAKISWERPRKREN